MRWLRPRWNPTGTRIDILSIKEWKQHMLRSKSWQDNVVEDANLRGYSFMVNEAVFILFSTLALIVRPPFTWNKFSWKSFTHLPYIIATEWTRLFSFISESDTKTIYQLPAPKTKWSFTKNIYMHFGYIHYLCYEPMFIATHHDCQRSNKWD